MKFAGDRDYGNTQKQLDYIRTMDLDVESIDKNDIYTRSTIYEAIYAPYFGGVKLFTKAFINQCKNI